MFCGFNCVYLAVVVVKVSCRRAAVFAAAACRDPMQWSFHNIVYSLQREWLQRREVWAAETTLFNQLFALALFFAIHCTGNEDQKVISYKGRHLGHGTQRL